MIKKVALGIVLLVAVGLASFFALAWRPEIAAVAPPSASTFAPSLVASGAVLAGAGDCAICHTAKGGQPFEGGLAFPTNFGTVYSSNITPDPETGIGSWSEAAFRRALHEGVARDGSHLFPVFPYTHFTLTTDGDVSALYAFLMTRDPVKAPERENTLPFPLNVRALQEGWKLLYFRAGRFVPDNAKSPELNRGAYLAEGLGHCGGCHTPRNGLGAEEARKTYGGALVEGQMAPPLTDANYAPVPWSEAELFAYLRTGTGRYHSPARGQMAEVIHDGLSKSPDADIQALAAYFAELGNAASHAQAMAAAIQRADAADGLDLQRREEPGARLYVAACASCHYNAAGVPLKHRPELAHLTLVNAADPDELIRIILQGRQAQMPAFAKGFSDSDVAGIAAYLRQSRTSSAPWPHLDQDVARIRAEASATP